jgi:hypothetical protein
MKTLISARSTQFELTHDRIRPATVLKGLGESIPSVPVPFSDLNDFAVGYRYDLLFQHVTPNVSDLIETVRLIREHVVARITALSPVP